MKEGKGQGRDLQLLHETYSFFMALEENDGNKESPAGLDQGSIQLSHHVSNGQLNGSGKLISMAQK